MTYAHVMLVYNIYVLIRVGTYYTNTKGLSR